MTDLIQPSQKPTDPLWGFDQKLRARRAERDQFMQDYQGEQGDPIEPCTHAQMNETLKLLRSHCSQGTEATRYKTQIFTRIFQDMEENLEYGTDVTGNSLSKGSLAAWNRFLKTYPEHECTIRFTECATITARWENQHGRTTLSFGQDGSVYCSINTQPGTFYGMAEGVCKVENIAEMLQNLRKSGTKAAFATQSEQGTGI